MAPEAEIIVIRPTVKAFGEWLAAMAIFLFYDWMIMVVLLLIVWYKVGTRKFEVAPDRIVFSYGLIMKITKTVRIDQIKEVYVKQGPIQKPFNVGDVRIISRDELVPKLDIKGIPDPAALKSLLARYAKRLKEADKAA